MSKAGKGRKQGAAKVSAREKERTAVELRKAGATYQSIAQQLGYSGPSSAFAAVKRVLDRTERETADSLRHVEYERLNHMLLVLWPRVQMGELAAMDRALGIMDRLHRMMGLDVPSSVSVSKTDVLVIDGDKTQYIKALRDIATRALEQAHPEGEVIDVESVLAESKGGRGS